MKPNERWKMIRGRHRDVWGVKIEPGMRLRDLPDDMRIAAIQNEGALEPIRFKGSRFFHVEWEQDSPLDWPQAVETEVPAGDWLVEMPNGGIGHMRGQQ